METKIVKKDEKGRIVEVKNPPAPSVSPWKQALDKAIVVRTRVLHGTETAPDPFAAMTAEERKQWKGRYPSAALGLRAMLSFRASSFAECVSFSQAMYGGTVEKVRTRVRAVLADKQTKMADRYKMHCTDGRYSITARA